MLKCYKNGCSAKVTHRLRLIAEDSGEVLEVDLCYPHADAMNKLIKHEVPGSTWDCTGTILVDKDGNQINEGSVH